MGLETIEHYTVPNIWMGPDALFFISKFYQDHCLEQGVFEIIPIYITITSTIIFIKENII